MPTSRTPSPIDDLTYDVITVLQNKAKALEAYDKYLSDAEGDEELTELFLEMRREDEEHVQTLKEVLLRRLEDDLGYEDEEGDDEEGDDEEGYEGEDEEEIEEPTGRGEDGPHIVGARGEDGPSGGAPRRGESTHARTR